MRFTVGSHLRRAICLSCAAAVIAAVMPSAVFGAVWGARGTVKVWNDIPAVVVINEVFAYNAATATVDDYSDLVGYVELYGQGGADLDGWTLVSDSEWFTTEYTFPSGVSIANEGYLRLWASGLEDSSDTSNIHLPFNLLGDVKVTLLTPTGAVASRMSTLGAYADTTFGRCEESCGAQEYDFFDTPTPGAVNASANRLAVVAKPYLALQTNVTTSLGVLTLDGGSPTYSLPTSDWLDPDPPTDGTVSVPWDWHDDPAETKVPPTVEVVRSTYDSQTFDTDVTVVGWEANRSTLRIIATPKRWDGNDIAGILSSSQVGDKPWRMLGASPSGNEDCVLFGRFGSDNIYCTKDGFQTASTVGAGPSGLASVQAADYTFQTPLGYFMLERDGTTAPYRVIPWKSNDLSTWTRQEVGGSAANDIPRSSLLQGFDFHYDVGTDTLYVYTNEYSSQPDTNTYEHGIYRAVYTDSSMLGDFVRVHSFPTRNSLDPDGVKHIHALRVDPYTGDVWVGTGDGSYESKLMVSYDNGATFSVFATGDQTFRTLGFWFTPDAVWFNNDTTSAQSVHRLDRSHRVGGEWEPIAQLYEDSGTLTIGASYVIYAIGAGSAVPSMGTCAPTCSVLQIVTDTAGTVLVSGDKLYAAIDPALDYRESWLLDHGSHWYFMPMDDPLGDGGSFTLMSMSAHEGTVGVTTRDETTRMFGIRESADGTDIDIQEVLGWPVPGGAVQDQFNAGIVGSNEMIYMLGRGLEHGYYVGELEWSAAP